MSYITYVLVARGVVVDSKLVKAFRRKKFSLKYKMKPNLAPRARLIVFYTNKEYMIWDSIVLDFDVFHNDVRVKRHILVPICATQVNFFLFDFSSKFSWTRKNTTQVKRLT